VPLVKVQNGKTRFLSPDEETRLLDKLGPIYGPWARLAMLTGLRLGEQIRLRWADVDLDRGLLTLPETKAGTVQYVRLNDEAKDILRTRQIQQMNRHGASPFVYPSDTLASPLDQRNFYARIFRPGCARAPHGRRGLAYPPAHVRLTARHEWADRRHHCHPASTQHHDPRQTL
jgi:integrase